MDANSERTLRFGMWGETSPSALASPCLTAGSGGFSSVTMAPVLSRKDQLLAFGMWRLVNR